MSKIISMGDVECYRDYFALQLKDVETGQRLRFFMWSGQPLDIMGMRMALAMREVRGFNFIAYDKCIISAALAGADNGTLKSYNDAIIVGGTKWWDFYRQFNITEANFDCVDLIEVAPGVRISLKMYAGRMHSRTIQDLPIDPASSIAPHQRPVLSHYCDNDLDVTHDMSTLLEGRLALRVAIGERYGIDVRSKSDAQIAEAVVKAQLPFKPQKQMLPHGHQFYYQVPGWVKFITPQMQHMLEVIRSTPFTVNDVDQIKRSPTEEIYDLDGAVVKTGLLIPPEIKGTDIRMGHSVYRMGIGGLHSQEAARAIFSGNGVTLSDHDVASYYPTLILLAGMFPPAVGEQFLAIYRAVYDERLQAKANAKVAKKAGDKHQEKHWKTIADSLKITLNGAFGKLGSKYSILFAPELLIQTTITGQLALLMLIEAMESRGISVMSANTDGIILATPDDKLELRDRIISWWEERTGLETEATFYSAVFNRSVNDYVAYTTDGEVKRKGTTFAAPGLLENKHPDREICADAVIAWLSYGTPVDQTIKACTDIRKFVRVRQVQGGGVWTATGEYLGKVVRWYWGTGNGGHYIAGAKSGNKVASSDGAMPLMTLPDQMPADIDYTYYIAETMDIIREIGMTYSVR